MLDDNPALFKDENNKLHYENLNYLSIARNQLSKVPVTFLEGIMESLEILDLSFNTFNDLGYENDQDTFPKSPNLKELILRSCQITSISENAFKNLISLEKVDLRHNFLYHIPIGVLKPSIKILQFESIATLQENSYFNPEVSVESGLEILSITGRDC